MEDGRASRLLVLEGVAAGERRLLAALEAPRGAFLASWRIDRGARGVVLTDPDNVPLDAQVVGLARAGPRTAAVALATGQLTLTRLADRRVLERRTVEAQVRDLAGIPGDGRASVALLRPSGDLAFLDLEGGGRIEDGPRGVAAHAVAAGVGRLACATARGVTVYDVAARALLGEVASGAPPLAVAVAPDGAWLACSYQDGTIALHDARGPALARLGAADLGPAQDFAVVLHAADPGHLLAGTRRGAVLRFEVRASK